MWVGLKVSEGSDCPVQLQVLAITCLELVLAAAVCTVCMVTCRLAGDGLFGEWAGGWN